jgi:soluble lytic murein transglycosylase-like protein
MIFGKRGLQAVFLLLLVWLPIDRAHAADCSTETETTYYADAYADHYNVPRELVHAIITQESGWNPRVVSNKGALGLMQLMPGTAKQFGVRDPFAISDNIGGGVRYLASLIEEFGGDLRMAVAAYYCGSHAIATRGLSYSNPDVLSYVMSVRRLYRGELTKHAVLLASTTQPGDDGR